MSLRALAVAFALVGAATAFADEPGIVKVQVILESKTVKGLLRDVPEAEREAARAIVRAIGDSGEMSFVRWHPGYARISASAMLTVTLYDRKPPAPDLPADHFLRYEGAILAPEGKDVRPLLGEYGKGMRVFARREEQRKLGSTRDLAEALADVVTTQLKEKSSHFHATFLYKIPLSRIRPTIEDEGTVVVELPWEDMGAANQSVLRIDIAARPPQQRGNETGQILVEDLLPCSTPSCARPSARGTPRKLNCRGIGPYPPGPWAPIAAALRAGLTSHVVYMEMYVPSYSARRSTAAADFEE
jgi:hypothetical protein